MIDRLILAFLCAGFVFLLWQLLFFLIPQILGEWLNNRIWKKP